MKNEKLLNFALESLGKGISVIPVGKNKIPLISWKRFQETRATEEEVRSWFEIFDDPQIGFVTGKISNLLVIDVEKGGDPSFLPQDTTIVSTGGGGYHYYFIYEEGVMNKARIRPLIDWRGEGGYVISPNSLSEKGTYEVLQEASWLKFPKELFPVDIFQTPERISTPNFNNQVETYVGVGKGERNDSMTRYIGHVLARIHPEDWEIEGWALIEQANQLNTPPLALSELRGAFKSIKRIDRASHPIGRRHGLSPMENEIEPLILSDDDEIKHIADVADEQHIDPGDVYPLQMPCFDNAILGGVSVGDIVVISGQTAHGKTTICQDWTMSLIRGEKKAKALWFSYEVLATHLWMKFQEMGMTREDCVFIPAKHSNGNVAWVEAKIKEGKEKFGIKTVFIDHLGFLLPKTTGILGKNLSSNYASFLTQIMRDLKTIALKEEVIIFLPVHMKKPEYGNRQVDINSIRDSGGISQEADLVFLIERERDKEADSKTYFTDTTKITLAKNRKTGVTVIGKFTMIKGRFAYDDSKEKVQKIYDEFNEDEEKKEPVEQPLFVPSVHNSYKDDLDDIADVPELDIPGW